MSKKRSGAISFREINALRDGDPTMEELEEFFARRDRFIASVRKLKKTSVDYLEYSPMVLRTIWTKDPELPPMFLTKQEKATEKGRRIALDLARQMKKVMKS